MLSPHTIIFSFDMEHLLCEDTYFYFFSKNAYFYYIFLIFLLIPIFICVFENPFILS